MFPGVIIGWWVRRSLWTHIGVSGTAVSSFTEVEGLLVLAELGPMWGSPVPWGSGCGSPGGVGWIIVRWGSLLHASWGERLFWFEESSMCGWAERSVAAMVLEDVVEVSSHDEIAEDTLDSSISKIEKPAPSGHVSSKARMVLLCLLVEGLQTKWEVVQE